LPKHGFIFRPIATENTPAGLRSGLEELEEQQKYDTSLREVPLLILQGGWKESWHRCLRKSACEGAFFQHH
jgi:hypothetical protein